MLPQISQSLLDVQPIDYRHNQYLGHQETAVLVALMRSVAPRVVIEVGCQRGLTAKCILRHVQTIRAYIAVDVPSYHHCTLPSQNSEVPFIPGIDARRDDRFYTLVRERGSLDLTPSDLEPCDAVFIDGDHSEDAVRSDSMLARALVRPGGIIIYHDYGNRTVEVTPALDRLHSEGWPIQHVSETWLAFMRI